MDNKSDIKLTENKKNLSNSKLSQSRVTAFQILSLAKREECSIRHAINKLIAITKIDEKDKKYAIKLSLGVEQMKLTLDEVIFSCLNKNNKVKFKTITILRIATFELLYLGKEPYVAVDQGVELAAKYTPYSKSFCNFVLHRIAEKKEGFPYGNPDTDKSAFCRLFSIQPWIYDYFKEDIGRDMTRNILSNCNGQPPLYIFVNPLKTTVDDIFKKLEDCGAEPEVVNAINGIELKFCIWVKKPYLLNNQILNELCNEGYIIISDAAAQAVASFALSFYLHDDYPHTMLEVCSGSGNKTIMLQSLIHDKFNKFTQLTTLDDKEYKTNNLLDRVKKCNLEVFKTYTQDATKIESESLGTFSHVFVDAPCSGLGTIRRHPEIKWRIKPEIIDNLASKGLEILKQASKCVEVGGFLTYSVCTITNKETIDVIDKFLQSFEGQDFVVSKFMGKREVASYYTTQTQLCLFDNHFACQLKRVEKQ